MNGPSGRMLELLSLLQNGRTWHGADLAERLGTSARTLRRDIDRLRQLGYPVASMRGPGGSYQLGAGRAMPPLLLSDDEAVAAVVGLRFAALAQVDGATGAAEGALRKLEQVLPPRLRYRMEAVSSSTEAVSRATHDLDLRTVQLLATSAHAHHDVRYQYISRGGHSSERRVEPYRLVLFDRRWYLLGWDLDRQDWRTFRLDRIQKLSAPGSTFLPRELPADGAASFVHRGSRPPVSRHQGVVHFAAPLAVVAERLIAEAGSLEATCEQTCRYVTATDSWQWLAITLAKVGVPYTIEGPAELLSYSRQLAQRIARAAQG